MINGSIALASAASARLAARARRPVVPRRDRWRRLPAAWRERWRSGVQGASRGRTARSRAGAAGGGRDVRVRRHARTAGARRGFPALQFAMSMFGAGHAYAHAADGICLDDVLQLPALCAGAVTTAVPIMVDAARDPAWARFLDRHHVIVFRSVHSKVTVAPCVLLVAGRAAAPAAAAVAGGDAAGHRLAAGSLGWTLGHNDFAPRGEETRYMALHVTLTGVRGLVAPPLAIAAYHLLERCGLDSVRSRCCCRCCWSWRARAFSRHASPAVAANGRVTARCRSRTITSAPFARPAGARR